MYSVGIKLHFLIPKVHFLSNNVLLNHEVHKLPGSLGSIYLPHPGNIRKFQKLHKTSGCHRNLYGIWGEVWIFLSAGSAKTS